MYQRGKNTEQTPVNNARMRAKEQSAPPYHNCNYAQYIIVAKKNPPLPTPPSTSISGKSLLKTNQNRMATGTIAASVKKLGRNPKPSYPIIGSKDLRQDMDLLAY